MLVRSAQRSQFNQNIIRYSHHSRVPYAFQANPHKMALISSLAFGCILISIIGLAAIFDCISGMNVVSGSITLGCFGIASFCLISYCVKQIKEHALLASRQRERYVEDQEDIVPIRHIVTRSDRKDQFPQYRTTIALSNPNQQPLSKSMEALKRAILCGATNAIRDQIVFFPPSEILDHDLVYDWLRESTLSVVDFMSKQGFCNPSRMIPLAMDLGMPRQHSESSLKTALKIIRLVLNTARIPVRIFVSHKQGNSNYRSTFIIEKVRLHHADPFFIRFFKVFLESGKFDLSETDEMGCAVMDYALIYRAKPLVEILERANIQIEYLQLQGLREIIYELRNAKLDEIDLTKIVRNMAFETYQDNSLVRAFCNTKGFSEVTSENSYEQLHPLLNNVRLARLDCYIGVLQEDGKAALIQILQDESLQTGLDFEVCKLIIKYLFWHSTYC